MHEWIAQHPSEVWWLLILSAATFVASILAGPLWAVRIPPDYFSTARRRREARESKPTHIAWVAGRNIVGMAFIATGLFLLLLPGQGLLTVLVGVMLTDFPGKYRIARWIVMRPPIRTSVNWLRRRAGQAPLQLD